MGLATLSQSRVRSWTRTNDLFRVREVRYHLRYANDASGVSPDHPRVHQPAEVPPVGLEPTLGRF